MNSIFNRLLRYFIQGAIFIIPIALTFYLIMHALALVDGIIPIDIPGLGFLIVIVAITTIGFLGSSIIIQPILNYFDSILVKTPGIKIIYTSVKDLTSALMGKDKKFNKPVLVKLNKHDEEYRIGFITNDDIEKYLGITEDVVAVYFPHSYAFSGYVAIVPKQNVKAMTASSSDVMKFIVSGGIADLD
ncbi:MAG: DUF502 domain-containing protein [Bacteroidia bacterium]|nr:DUF502 domain-containing protein [Bacteroidia bacterium]